MVARPPQAALESLFMGQGMSGDDSPRARIGVNPEALRAMGRALLRDPLVKAFAGVVEAVAPELADAVRELDEHLPDVVGAVEIEARARLHREAKGVTRKVVKSIRGLVDEAAVITRKRAPKTKRLRAAPARSAKK